MTIKLKYKYIIYLVPFFLGVITSFSLPPYNYLILNFILITSIVMKRKTVSMLIHQHHYIAEEELMNSQITLVKNIIFQLDLNHYIKDRSLIIYHKENLLNLGYHLYITLI